MFNYYYHYVYACASGLALFGMAWASYDFLVYRRFRSLALLSALFLFYALLTKIPPLP